MYCVSQRFRWWQVRGKADLYVAQDAQDSSSSLLCAEAMQVYTLPLHLLLMLQQKAAHLHHVAVQQLTCQYLLTLSQKIPNRHIGKGSHVHQPAMCSSEVLHQTP